MPRILMKVQGAAMDLVGSDIEFPSFDPLGFTKTAAPNQVDYYRAAELKHGRIAMLAALGEITQYFYHLPDPVFNQASVLIYI